MANNGHPTIDVYEFNSPGQATAGTDTTWTLDRIKRAGSITKVTYTPNADITGAANNNRAFTLLNKGQDGNGTQLLANKTMLSGINMSDFDETSIDINLNPALVKVIEGDILAWFSDANGTGMIDPGGLVRVEVTTSGAGHSAAGMVRGFPAL